MKAWESFVEAQEAEVGRETAQKWLKTLKVVDYDACNLHLEAQDSFQTMWFEEHMRPKISTLVNNNKKRINVHLSTANVPAKAKGRSVKSGKKVTASPSTFTLTFDELDPNATFAKYVVSQSNQLTHRVMAQIAGVEERSEGVTTLNPLYIYGTTGSGKTHLLMAMADALRKQGKHVIFSGAQTFTDHVVSAIRAGEMSVFRQAYRNSDVLIIDDVHIFSRKGATQEEFFHTFNSLQGAGKQIILSANCAPGELQLIEPRLVSRFEWGIVLPLEPAYRADAEKILLAKAKAMDFPLHGKVADFLLESFSTAKSLTKALEALILRSHLGRNQGKMTSSQITVLQAKQVLTDLLVEEKQSTMTPQRIVQHVSEFFGIKPEDVLGKGQTRDCVLPRQISMHLCRTQLKMPYMKIADIFSKDHSTVMSSVKLIQKGIEADDQEIAGAYRSIMRKIKA